MYSLFTPSSRDFSNILLLPKFSRNFTYQAAKIWNATSKSIIKSSHPADIKTSLFKKRLKANLLDIQKMHNGTEWIPGSFDTDSFRCI